MAADISDLIESYRRDRGNLRAHVVGYLARQKRCSSLARKPIAVPDSPYWGDEYPSRSG